MSDRGAAVLYSGGHKGAEAEFGRQAEAHGIEQVTLTFPGHVMEHSANVRELSEAELAEGDVSMGIVSRRMGRTYHRSDRIRRVFQSLFHMVVNADQVLAVGWIQPDGTVKGGTGWGVELAKLFNREVSVFDQERESWHTWDGHDWVESTPVIHGRSFAGTGTRHLSGPGKRAIRELFERSFETLEEET